MTATGWQRSLKRGDHLIQVTNTSFVWVKNRDFENWLLNTGPLYIQVRLYLNNAFWNLETLSKWVGEWVSEWVSKSVNNNSMMCIYELTLGRTRKFIPPPWYKAGGRGVVSYLEPQQLSIPIHVHVHGGIFRNVQKETTHLLEVLQVLSFL